MITNSIKNFYNLLSNTLYNFFKKIISTTSITHRLSMIGGNTNKIMEQLKFSTQVSRTVMMLWSIVMIMQKKK